MATIKMPDNQSFELDDEIAKDDNLLRGALKAGYPDAANATFERTGGKDGKPLAVKVIKKAGTKGIVADLLAGPEFINPAILMQQEIVALESGGQVDHAQMLAMRDEIKDAIDQGEREIRANHDSLKVLFGAEVEAAMRVPTGF